MNTSQDNLSRLGLYFGPALLGLFVANGIFRIACDGRSSFVSSGGDASPLAPVFFLFAIVVPLRKMDPFMRAGMIGFALWQALRVYVWMTENRLPDFVGWTGIICALLFTAAGLRGPGRHKAAIAVGVCLAMFAFSIITQRAGRELIGRRSLMSDSVFCRS